MGRVVVADLEFDISRCKIMLGRLPGIILTMGGAERSLATRVGEEILDGPRPDFVRAI
jgi:hypothetical protein